VTGKKWRLNLSDALSDLETLTCEKIESSPIV